ncbi:PHD finger-like domain-containing protein 5A isoform X1 [Sapajus apella]|uniref:PHD finger-like domain-containing protein 5A isoform X1 n=2 Tax=Sapajus apella TaxID=9515 RepID=A0A6J3GZP9_SAPAP|nr:PHD finger-like domain-containing protein 5A isoform X1 [Sapajus apella]
MAKHHPDLIFCRKQAGVGETAPCPRLSGSRMYFPSLSKPLIVLFTIFDLAAIGRLCEKCDGKCVICDSYVRPCTLVRICDECNYGSYQGRCVICGGPGVSDAYYCKECTIQEKDRDGCPKIVNLGSSKTDLFYERKKYGFKKR